MKNEQLIRSAYYTILTHVIFFNVNARENECDKLMNCDRKINKCDTLMKCNVNNEGQMW